MYSINRQMLIVELYLFPMDTGKIKLMITFMWQL